MQLEQTVPPNYDQSSTPNKANEAPKEKRFKPAVWFAWLLCGIVIVLALFGVATDLGAPDTANNFIAIANAVMTGAFTIAFGVVGALILARYPRHTIGWLLMFIGLALVIIGILANLLGEAASGSGEPGIATYLSYWLSSWDWWLLIGPLLLIVLLFPTGHLLSPRWRWVVVAIGALFAFFLFYATFSKNLTDPTSNKTLPNPLGVIPESVPFEVVFIPFAIGLLATVAACVASVIVRYRRATTTEREQIKWFLFACIVFLFVYAWGIILADSNNPWGLVFDAAILFVPVSIGIAILRYRLFDIDFIIRRTAVYVPLTAILAGLFAVSIDLCKRFFVALTGQQSDAATVLATLIVVAAFEPVKQWLQRIVDSRFKEAPDPARPLRAFRDEVQKGTGAIDARRMTGRLLAEAMAAFEATGGAAFLSNGEGRMFELTRGTWNGDAGLRVSLGSNGAQMGEIALGARKNGLSYSEQDRAALVDTANVVAEAINGNGAEGEWVEVPATDMP